MTYQCSLSLDRDIPTQQATSTVRRQLLMLRCGSGQCWQQKCNSNRTGSHWSQNRCGSILLCRRNDVQEAVGMSFVCSLVLQAPYIVVILKWISQSANRADSCSSTETRPGRLAWPAHMHDSRSRRSGVGWFCACVGRGAALWQCVFVSLLSKSSPAIRRQRASPSRKAGLSRSRAMTLPVGPSNHHHHRSEARNIRSHLTKHNLFSRGQAHFRVVLRTESRPDPPTCHPSSLLPLHLFVLSRQISHDQRPRW